MNKPQAQELMIDLKLPLSQVNLALEGLAELPLKRALPAVENIQRQAMAFAAAQEVKARAGAAPDAKQPAAPANRAARRATGKAAA